EVLGKRQCLPQGKIDFGLSRLREIVSAAIGYHTNDFRRRPLPSVSPNLLSDWICMRKVTVHQNLVDDGYVGRFRGIGGTEIPAIGNFQAHEFEVVLGN